MIQNTGFCVIKATLMAAALLCGASGAFAADFAGAGAVIPDNVAAGVNIPFNVSGITPSVGAVRISVNLTHSFVGDLRATLISPGGTARLVLFSRTGFKRSTSSGISANLGGNYVFDDVAGTDLWAAVSGLTTAQVVPPGTYRTSTGGKPALSNQGGCTTFLGRAFSGLSGAQVNGTWTLNIADLVSGDTGVVNSAILSVDQPLRLFADGFEDAAPPVPTSSVTGNCVKSYFDYTGGGLASYVLVRNTGGGPTGAITWFIKDNDGTLTGTEQNFVHGIATDSFVDGDFDGDGIADAVVYRPSLGAFLVRRSSRPNDTVLTIPLGQVGDDTKQIGDYDGDGVSDAAVYRAGASAGLASQTLIRLSSTGLIRTLVTGENGAFASGGSDLNGDGKADMAIQSNAGGGAGRFRFFDGVSGSQFADFNFGTPTDVIVTGNHFGSALADVTTIRGIGGSINWSTRDTGTGVGQPAVILGASATDFILTGDYDGDGLDDYATWRPNSTAGQSKFIVRKSASPATPVELFFGANGDYPVANGRTH